MLAVDDDPELTALVGAYLSRLDDVSVLTETDPQEALARLDEAIDCVVCDYDMVEMDGIAVLDTVRDRYPDLPFVLFTATDDERIAERARERDAAFVHKNGAATTFDRLVGAVESALDG